MPSTARTVPREVSNRTCRSRTSSSGVVAAPCDGCRVSVSTLKFGIFLLLLVPLGGRLYLIAGLAAKGKPADGDPRSQALTLPWDEQGSDIARRSISRATGTVPD